MKKISPCLWFASNAEEAVRFYTSIFKDSRIIRTTYYGEEGFEIHGRPAGSVLTIVFELDGEEFTALNGGPLFKFNEAVSFQIMCDSQNEIDYYWDKLGQGGEEEAKQCGWLKDKFGLSWQVVPKVLNEMLSDSDLRKRESVMKALLQMKKLEIGALEKAYALR